MDAESQWVESQDWSHLLQTQAASEDLLQTQTQVQTQVQMQTQAYYLNELWGPSQLETQAYNLVDLWGSISIDSAQEPMDTQSYDGDLAVANYETEMETAATSLGRRVQKTAKPMAKTAAKAVVVKRARAAKKRPAADTLKKRPAADTLKKRPAAAN